MSSARAVPTSLPSDLVAHWSMSAPDVVARLDSRAAGLTGAEAAARLETYGPNRLMPRHGSGVLLELRRQFTQPIVLILVAATMLSLLLGDTVDAVIILGIVVLSGLLGFTQEHGASVTVARLLERVQIHVEVRRDGEIASVRPEDVVPGDVVVLNAGDVVPCDCRLLTAEALQVDESALTGETYPRHKHPDPAPAEAELARRHSSLFQGSHVVSGQAEAIAVVTGRATELGRDVQHAGPGPSAHQLRAWDRAVRPAPRAGDGPPHPHHPRGQPVPRAAGHRLGAVLPGPCRRGHTADVAGDRLGQPQHRAHGAWLGRR